ncbi:Uncharacterized protein HZ326_12669 [Fusarium oxysporum f. sp. albedinis]|nr:Uncharacterized protein HZ326_12669 [Fusarium oxysporum f. sp. albedinis]
MPKAYGNSHKRQTRPDTGPRRVRGPYALGGCHTCRRRHVKCDQVKPVCLTCQACGETCDGFSDDLCWVGASSSSKRESPADPSQGSRRHLYTEQSRALMAAAISASVPSSSVGTVLVDIDDHSRNPHSFKTPEITIGPFGVFDANPDRELATAATFNVESNADADATVSNTDPATDICDWDGYIVWDDLFTLDIENTPWMPSATGYTDRGLLESAPDFQTPTDLGYSRTARISHTESYMSMNTLPLMPSFKDELGTVDWHSTDITFLLRNFNSVVMPRMASVPLAKKFAWGPMHHELAVQTLAEVTFLKKPEVNEAKLANLCAIVAISSHHLYLTREESFQSAEYWLQLSAKTIRHANIHLSRSLESETRGPKTAKYKEQLMAVQALMAHAWVTSNQAEARRFQLEAERLVRFRGLSKRNISRRIRLLHHAYTWNRIVGESTYVLHDYGTFQHAISASCGEPAISDGAEANIMANESSSHSTQENTRLDDFLRIGHRFEERLSNNRLVEILERRAQSLEDAICSFVESRNLSASIDANDPPNVCMFRCLTAALLIFFYRRIRNVHPLVLQVYVDQIIRGLEIFDDSLARHGQAGPGSAWAAFIAGCEAMGESRREKLRQWMDRAFDSCRFQLYQRAKELMTRVWERRSMAQEYQQRVPRRPSWMEVSRETNTWIILN